MVVLLDGVSRTVSLPTAGIGSVNARVSEMNE